MGLQNLIRKYFPGILLFGFVIIEFDIMSKVPVPGLHTLAHTGFIVVNLAFLAYYVLYSLRQKTVSRFFLILIPIMLIPVLSGIQAAREFQQPFLLGFLAERSKYFAISGLALVHFIEMGWWSIDLVEKVVIRCAMAFMVVSLGLYLLVNPELFEGTKFVTNSAFKGYRFSFNQTFAVILFFYSLFKVLQYRERKYFFIILTILFYLFVFVKGRSLLVALLGATSLFMIRNFNLSRTLNYFIIFVLGGAGVLGLAYVIFPETFKTNIVLFSSAFNVFLGGEVVDSSAASRITQVQVAWEGIKANPLLGNGFVSSRFLGGFSGQHGHFYPSDIGWVGMMFLYGVIGSLVILSPFFIAFSYRRKLLSNNAVFLTTMQATLLYFFIHNITTGFTVKKYGMIVFVFAVIYYYRYLHQEREETAEDQPETSTDGALNPALTS